MNINLIIKKSNKAFQKNKPTNQVRTLKLQLIKNINDKTNNVFQKRVYN